MPFNSAGFLLFLFMAAVGFHLLPARARVPYLAVVSFVFYSFWSLYWLLMLGGLIAMSWGAALALTRASGERTKRRWFVLGTGVLALNLIAFKLLPAVFHHPLAIAGLSYYTFKLISYSIDVYLEKIPAEKDLLKFAAYTSFFPQIASGPIQRAGDFLRQIPAIGRTDPALILSGLRLVLWGFFKKLVIADRLSVLTSSVFGQPQDFAAPALWVAAYAYFFQLYADFSGITDIAIGAGRMFGITAPDNFDRPYLAKNLQDFWRRWHITLTSWVTDYVFTPLRAVLRDLGNAGLALCILVNMLLIATWHGGASNFIVFGCLQAVAVTISALTLKMRDRWFKTRPRWSRVRTLAAPLITFHLTIVSFVFFNAKPAEAIIFLRGMAVGDWVWSGWGTGMGRIEMGCLAAAVALLIAVEAMKSREKSLTVSLPGAIRVAADYVLVVLILGFGLFASNEFIYFKF